jgi:hypothetical protein
MNPMIPGSLREVSMCCWVSWCGEAVGAPVDSCHFMYKHEEVHEDENRDPDQHCGVSRTQNFLLFRNPVVLVRKITKEGVLHVFTQNVG